MELARKSTTTLLDIEVPSQPMGWPAIQVKTSKLWLLAFSFIIFLKSNIFIKSLRTKAAYRYDQNGKPARLSQKTLCMVGVQKDGIYRHYDVHNLYGYFESKHTLKAVRQATGKRSFVLSR